MKERKEESKNYTFFLFPIFKSKSVNITFYSRGKNSYIKVSNIGRP